MRAISGIIVIDTPFIREGSTTIRFNQLPGDGDSIANGRLFQPIQVGGSGNFTSKPTYIANIREWAAEDKVRGSAYDLDHFVLDTKVSTDHIWIRWKLKDNRGSIHEIGFMVVGE